MTRARCIGKKKNGEPCSLYALPNQTCCRFHHRQPQCGTPLKIHVDESTFEGSVTEAIVAYVKARFPVHAFYAQAKTDNVLEDFASSLVTDVMRKRRWNCFVARDGQFGLVGPLNEEYDTELCILTIQLPDDGFMLYLF